MKKEHVVKSANFKKIVVAIGDGIADDTDAMEKHLRGTHIAVRPDGTPVSQAGGIFRLTRAIVLSGEGYSSVPDGPYYTTKIKS